MAVPAAVAFAHSSARTFVTDAIDDLARGTGCMLAMLESGAAPLSGWSVFAYHRWNLSRGPAMPAWGYWVGYGVTRERWGVGFASEGAARATAFAFEGLGLSRLLLTNGRV